MRDELFEAQMFRALGYAPSGAADAGECLATASRISGTNLDQWHSEWLATARRVRELAEASVAAGHSESARNGFFHASNYYRTAGVFAVGSPIDARLVEAHRLEVDSFRQGAALLQAAPEIVEIAYEDGPLPGYLFRAGDANSPQATLILTTGYDGTAEELYFANGAAALARGYNVLSFDGPGQGSMIIDRGVPFRPDWESVIAPVVDFLVDQPGVDRRGSGSSASASGATSPRGRPPRSIASPHASLTAGPMTSSTLPSGDCPDRLRRSFPMAGRGSCASWIGWRGS